MRQNNFSTFLLVHKEPVSKHPKIDVQIQQTVQTNTLPSIKTPFIANMSTIDLLVSISKGDYQGRDKFAKSLQFFCTFTAHYLLQADSKNVLALRMNNLKKVLGTGRKALRLGKAVEQVPKLQKALATTKNPVDLGLKLLSDGSMVFRWIYDNLGFLNKAKVIDGNGTYGITSNKFRVIATVAYIILCIKAIFKTSAACTRAETEEEQQKANSDHFEATLALIGRCTDMVNALKGSKLYVTNDGFNGICGFISGIIAFRKVFVTAQKAQAAKAKKAIKCD